MKYMVAIRRIARSRDENEQYFLLNEGTKQPEYSNQLVLWPLENEDKIKQIIRQHPQLWQDHELVHFTVEQSGNNQIVINVILR